MATTYLYISDVIYSLHVIDLLDSQIFCVDLSRA